MWLIKGSKIKKSTKAIPIVVESKHFKSLTQACLYYKVCLLTFRIRRSQGWTIEEALGIHRKEYTNFKVGDKGFKNLNSACKTYGLAFNTVNKRLHRGWSIEEALELTARKQNASCRGLLYKITNKNSNKVYIGITSRSLEDRFTSHKYQAKKGSNSKLHKAMKKYGCDSFRIEIIQKSSNWHKLRKLEILAINKYNSIKTGYNTSAGGSGATNQCGTKVIYKGVKFISIKSLAAYLGINKSTLEWRIKRGNSIDSPVRVQRRAIS